MTYKRKIHLEIPETSLMNDPLRRYYIAGGFLKPEREDSSLEVEELIEDGLLFNSSLVKWSLGGYENDNAKISTQKQIDDWCKANKSTLQDNTEINQNPYMTEGPDGQVISLPKVLQQLHINTIDALLVGEFTSVKRELDSIEIYDEDINIVPEAGFFLGMILTSSTPNGALYGVIRQMFDRDRNVRPRFLTLGDVFEHIVFGIETTLLDKIAVFKGIEQVFTRTQIITFLLNSSLSDYRITQITEDVPFMTGLTTHEFLEVNAGIRGEQGKAQVDPEYILFNERYEQAISGTTSQETVQPNLYLYDLYTSKEVNEEGIAIGEGWQGDPSLSNLLLGKYGVSVTLDGNIDPNQNLLNDTSMSDYLQTYSKELECNVTAEQKVKINNLLSKTIFPSTDMNIIEELNEKKNFFPMYVETSFVADHLGSVGRIIENNNTSTTMLDYLSENNGESKRYNIKSDVFFGNAFSNMLDQSESEYIHSLYDFGDQNLLTTNVYQAIEYGLDKETVQGLTITKNGLEPITGVLLSDQQKNNINRVSNNVRSTVQQEVQSYADHLSDLRNQSYSESLGYKLTKFDSDGQKIQEIVFGNNLTSRQIRYVDTQVKYDKNYRYELSEYRLTVSTQYKMIAFSQEPKEFITLSDEEKPDTLAPSVVFYDIYTIEKPIAEVIEIPIYSSIYSVFNWFDEGSLINTETFYPETKVLARPPVAADLQLLPLLDNYRQIKIIVNPNSGEYVGDNALPIISLPNLEERIQNLFRHQKQFENFGLQMGHLEYRNEGIQEIKKVHLLRSKDLDMSVPRYEDLYASFFTSQTGQIRTLSTDPDAGEETVLSYDILDDLEINTYYYYSCYVEDAHGNPSLPSPIYRVRLVYEKGLYIPEIELFNYKPVSNTVPTRKFARFVQISASDIQSFPFTERDANNVLTGIKNIASQGGTTVSDGSFIFRFTSRDTGRKFDLKINVREKTLDLEDENISDCE